MNTTTSYRFVALAAALLVAGLASSPALAWGPWGGWGPWDNGMGPFSGFGGPFTGNMGPWSMGSFHLQRPYGGPMRFSTGPVGGYGEPYQGYYGGAGYGYSAYSPGYRPYAPTYPPVGEAYYGYPEQNGSVTMPPAPQESAAPASNFVPPPPGPFSPY